MTGNEVKQWREKEGLTRMEFSVKHGIPYHTLQKWELGLVQPSRIWQAKLEEMKGEEK